MTPREVIENICVPSFRPVDMHAARMMALTYRICDGLKALRDERRTALALSGSRHLLPTAAGRALQEIDDGSE